MLTVFNGISGRNKLISLLKQQWFYVFLFFISVVYFFFPTNNHLVDSVGYAADVKYATNLFAAHHLFFTAFNFLIYRSVSFVFPSVDALGLVQGVNALFSVLNLILLRSILRKTNTINADVWVVFVAVSFGVFRFSVEAETYIIPIFFSLCSSYFALRYFTEHNSKYILLSGFFASLACLFHQIHLFWGIGLFLGFVSTRKIKNVLLYLLPTSLVLIGYVLVLVYYNHETCTGSHLFRFLAQYYYTSNDQTPIGLNNVLLLFIGLFRTFFQIHGIIIYVLKWWPAFYILLFATGVFLTYFVLNIFKSLKINKVRAESSFERIHLLIFFLQLCFAFFSSGNSEFMVMLPYLMAMFLPYFFSISSKSIIYISLAMFVWNFSFAIFPNHKSDYQNNKQLVDVINSNKEKVFIVKERNLVVNLYYYNYGIMEYAAIVDIENKKAIRKFNEEGKVFYTDILTKKTPYSRTDFTLGSANANFLFVRHVTEIENRMGNFYIDEVKVKD